jgi:tRNA threonylcarbamoyladenosine biosynthesis protein TsaB
VILSIRTDKEQAEVGLFDANGKQLTYKKWLAHRELSKDIHKVIKERLDEQKIAWKDLSGIIFYAGPGSFTGLRIGASVANTLASEVKIPIADASGDNWVDLAIKNLKENPKNYFVLPTYGRPARITTPRK